MPARFMEKRAGVRKRTKTPRSPIHNGYAWTPGQLSSGDLRTGTVRTWRPAGKTSCVLAAIAKSRLRGSKKRPTVEPAGAFAF